MMKAGVLFSGGKDSALAALLLAPHYEVEVVTFASLAGRNLDAVEAAGAALGLAWRRETLPDEILGAALDRIAADGYPNNAINLVHQESQRPLRVLGDHHGLSALLRRILDIKEVHQGQHRDDIAAQ